MLVSARPAWRYVLPQLGLPLAILFTYSTAVSFAAERGFLFVSLPDLPLSLMGAALGIFLGFRTNSAYDRWWEARTLWGQLVNQSRTLARQAMSFTRGSGDRLQVQTWIDVMLRLQIAYVHALRCHLRGENPLASPSVRRYLDEPTRESLSAERNVPAGLLLSLGNAVGDAATAGWIDALQWQRLDVTLTEITNVQGGCERIKNTPLPRQYDLFPEFFAYVYCLLLPLGLVGRLGFATAPLVVLIGFVFLATNRIGRNIENPFENSPHDTPMTALASTIESHLLRALGDHDLPSIPTPVNGVLM